MEPNIRDIVPMVKIDPIVVPERLTSLPRRQVPEEEKIPDDLIKKYTVQVSEDSLEMNEILSKNA